MKIGRYCGGGKEDVVVGECVNGRIFFKEGEREGIFSLGIWELVIRMQGCNE